MLSRHLGIAYAVEEEVHQVGNARFRRAALLDGKRDCRDHTNEIAERDILANSSRLLGTLEQSASLFTSRVTARSIFLEYRAQQRR